MFIEGFLLGLAYAMPIGMQNLFVLQQALAGPRRSAFFSSACVALADVSLAFACFFGVGKMLDYIPLLKPVLLVSGAAFLLWTAWGLFRSSEVTSTADANRMSRRKIALTAFGLTWLNPHAVVDGSILIGSYSARLQGLGKGEFLTGLAVASPLWFFTLTSVGVFFADSLSPRRMVWVNRTAGAFLLLLSFALLKAVVS